MWISTRVNEKLMRIGLPACNLLVGRLFTFESKHGSHYHLLCGTITGISISDEGGLELFVSIPEIWGERFRSLIYNEIERSWRVCMDVEIPPEEFERRGDDALSDKFLPGKLELV